MTTIAINPSLVNRGEKTPENRHYSRVRLTPRGRFITRLAVIASLSILLLSGFAAVTGASAGSTDTAIPTPYVKVSVKPGDTLWSIAESIAPHGDRRSLVADIVEINRLATPELQAGQKIYIPTRP
jgi:nucleoid-associated protein YgaU